jgi:hypothetical protein
MNVKIGMMLCKTASGISRANSEATSSARCEVLGFVDAITVSADLVKP